MAARASVQSLIEGLLANGEPLELLGFKNCYASNSVDTPVEDEFIIIRWEDQPQAFGNRGKQVLTIWFHLRDQDYTPIDLAMEEVKLAMMQSVHRVGADGWILTQADWRGDSPDLIDDGFKTITRNSSYEAVSRYATSEI